MEAALITGWNIPGLSPPLRPRSLPLKSVNSSIRPFVHSSIRQFVNSLFPIFAARRIWAAARSVKAVRSARPGRLM